MLKKSRNKGTGANKATVSYLLSGLIKCGGCGYGMYGNRRTNTRGNEYILKLGILIDCIWKKYTESRAV